MNSCFLTSFTLFYGVSVHFQLFIEKLGCQLRCVLK